MALTSEQKQELFAVLGRTGGHREVMKKAREIPAEYQAMLNQTRDAHMLLARFGGPSFGGLKNVNNTTNK